MGTLWRIELLGGLRVQGRGADFTRFRTQKAGELLAFLALHPDREHPRESLIDLLWPDDDLDSARNKLNVALSSLRRQVEPRGVPGRSVLVTGRVTVSLRAAGAHTDVAEFEETLDRAARANDPDERIAALRRGVALYRGPLLPGYYDDWVVAEQRRLETRYLEALRQLLPLLEQAGERREAIACAEGALAIDSGLEEMHLALIRLYRADGRPEAARRQQESLLRLRGETPAEDAPGSDLGNGSSGVAQPPCPPTRSEEPAGGAVALDSAYYLARPTDEELRAAISRRASIVLLKGPRQVGKTSLLARGLAGARASGARVVCTDLQLLNAEQLSSAEALLQSLARALAEELSVRSAAPVEPAWNHEDGPNLNFRRFIRRVLMAEPERPLVWGLDEVDRLFTCPYGTEVFAMFRAWHNERALDPRGPWSSLTLVIAYATEAHLFIRDANQSPFNVGVRLQLNDFTLDQLADLNRRHGSPVRSTADLRRLNGLVAGHPYLTQCALQEIQSQGLSVAEVERRADREDWIFGEHLRRLRGALLKDEELCAAVRSVLRGERTLSPAHFYRLRTAGILVGEHPDEARLRCELYQRYLRQHLGG